MVLAKLKTAGVQTWIWIAFLVVIILGFGLMTFTVVSDKGQPTWDYRAVEDLPSGSPYAEYDLLPFPQHIKGKGGK